MEFPHRLLKFLFSADKIQEAAEGHSVCIHTTQAADLPGLIASAADHPRKKDILTSGSQNSLTSGMARVIRPKQGKGVNNMSGIFTSVEQLIGNTPLLELAHIAGHPGARILAKLEYLNPAGSAKDRIGLSMLNEAEADGRLKPGGTVIEPTSGNTGIGLAMVGVTRGYRVIIVMPDSMSVERRLLMTAYGAELVLTDGALGMKGAIEKAKELAAGIPGSFIPDQFSNPDNPLAHYLGTGPEIWRDTGGHVDFFVAGVGTGGTITGTGRYLKEKNPDVKIVAVEPAASAVLSGKTAGPHGLQGIGAGFVPDALDTEIYDRVIPVTDEEAYAAGRLLARKEGILTGITSGAALHAAMLLASEPDNAGKTIVTLLPDTGDRYLSTPMYQEG